MEPRLPRPTRDDYFLQMLDLTAARSTCARRAVAAIVVDEYHHVLSTGYNGVPSGLPHCSDDVACPGAKDRPGQTDNCWAVHAEVNALLQADVERARTLYVSCTPCFVCAKAIANTPIRRVVVREAYADDRGLAIFLAAKIRLDVVVR
jgi:dCMP deaminase